MDELALLVDLHRDGARQGPGSEDTTLLAVELSGLRDARGMTIADLGCGTGASTLVLARDLDAHVVAVDAVAEFVAELAAAADLHPTSHISPIVASMEALPLPERCFDAVWSEGAVYNLGFRAGVSAWRRLLKPGGILAVSELTWRWFEHYYRPLQDRFAAYLDRHHHSDDARHIVEEETHEIDLYERFSSFVGYGFYVARTTEGAD